VSLRGDFTINVQELNKRDGLGIWNIVSLDIKARSQDAEILLMGVPMYKK